MTDFQDFETSPELKVEAKDLLEEMAFSSAVVAAEQRLALALLQILNKQDDAHKQNVSLDLLLAPPTPGVQLKVSLDRLLAPSTSGLQLKVNAKA